MNKQTTTEWIKQRDFVCKDIWDKREFKRTDGSTGSIQKILNVDDHNLLVWDHDDLKGIIIPGEKYSVTGIREKKNRDGYDEWNTGKFSTIGPIDSMDKMAPTQTALDTLEPYTRLPKGRLVEQAELPPTEQTDISNTLNHIGQTLNRLEKKLDDLAEMI